MGWRNKKPHFNISKPKYLLVLVFPLLFSFLLISATPHIWARALTKEEKQEINSLYKEALSCYSQNDLYGAEDIFRQILSIDPEQKKAQVFIDKKIPAREEYLERVRAKQEQAEAKREAAREVAARKKAERDARVRAKQEEARPRKERQQRLNDLYKEALTYYREDDLTSAGDVFEQILGIDPDHQRAKLFIEKKIPARQEKLQLLELVEQERESRDAEKRAKQEQALRKKEDREAQINARKEEILARKQRQQEINSLYKEALSCYSQNDLYGAEDIFRQILSIDPEQKKAQVFIDKKIPAREEYLERVELNRQAREARKLAKEEAARQKKTVDKEALKREAQEERLRRKQEREAEAEAKKEEARILKYKREKTDALLKEAIGYYRNNELIRAEETFEKAIAAAPNTERTRYQNKARLYLDKKIPAKQQRLDLIRQRKVAKIRKEEERRRKEEEKTKSDYITISRGKTAKDVLKDADHLYLLARYEEAIVLYNWAYDIARNKVLKKEILHRKKKARALLRLPKEKQEEVVARREERKNIKALYKEAVAYYSQDELAKAEDTFREVLRIEPGHQRAKLFIEKKIPARQEKLELLELIQQDRETRKAKKAAKKEERLRKREEKRAEREAPREVALRKKEEAEARKRAKQEEVEARKAAKQEEALRKKEEAEARKRAKQEEVLVRRERQQEIKVLYKEALTAYSQNDLSRAESLFEQILSIDPDQKKAQVYLDKKIPARAEYLERVELKKQEREAKRLPKEEALRRKEVDREAQKIAKQEVALRRKEEIAARKQRQQEINSLYKEALTAYSQNDLSRAESLFEQILGIDPEHKKASYYIELKIPAKQDKLELIRQKDEEAEARRQEIEEERARKREEAQARKTAKQEEAAARRQEIEEERARKREEAQRKKEEAQAQKAAKQEEARRKKEISAERKRALREETVRKHEEKQSITFLYNIALNYFRMGRYSDALHEADKILVLEPNNEKAIKLIEQIKEEQDKR